MLIVNLAPMLFSYSVNVLDAFRHRCLKSTQKVSNLENATSACGLHNRSADNANYEDLFKFSDALKFTVRSASGSDQWCQWQH